MPRHAHRPPPPSGPHRPLHGHSLPHELPPHLHDHHPPPEPPLPHHGPVPHHLRHVPPHLRHGLPHEDGYAGPGGGPLPPHMLHELAAGLFGPKEREALVQIFADQHTADRVYQALYYAPPEFALLAAVVLRCHTSAGKC